MSNVYDAVNRLRFLQHRAVTDPASAELISELIRYCDLFKQEHEQISNLLTERTKRLNKLEQMIGNIALALRDDMMSDGNPDVHPTDICFGCGADLFNEGPHKPECKYDTR